MKKLTLTAIAALISCIAFAQIEIRGRVTQVNRCELLDSGGYKIVKTIFPSIQTSIRINDNELVIMNDTRRRYELSDKIVDSSNNQLAIHYMSTFNKKLVMVAVMECGEGMKIGIFSMEGDTKFIEYIVPKVKVAKK